MIAQELQTQRNSFADKLDKINIVLSEFRRTSLPIDSDLPWNLRQLLAYVHANLFESCLTAATARRACKLQNNNISNQFRARIGLGLKQYIEACRMAAAQQLLTDLNIEVYLIALAVGYDHQETFFRAFQRITGCTPSSWRRASLQGGAPAEKPCAA